MVKNQVSRRYITLIELLIAMALTMLLLSTLTFFYHEIDHLNTSSEYLQKELFQQEFVESRLNSVITKIMPEANGRPSLFFTSNDLNGLLAPGSPSLVFTYETGANFDEQRAVISLGRLFLDKQNRLCLATWPDPEEWDENQPLEAHLEMLMENVQSLSFLFYVVPERDRSLAGKKKKNEGINPPPEKKPPVANSKPKENEAKKKPADGDKKTESQPEAKVEEEPAAASLLDTEAIEPEPKGQWISEWKRTYKQLPAMMKIIVVPQEKERDPIVFAFPLLKSKNVIVYE